MNLKITVVSSIQLLSHVFLLVEIVCLPFFGLLSPVPNDTHWRIVQILMLSPESPPLGLMTLGLGGRVVVCLLSLSPQPRNLRFQTVLMIHELAILPSTRLTIQSRAVLREFSPSQIINIFYFSGGTPSSAAVVKGHQKSKSSTLPGTFKMELEEPLMTSTPKRYSVAGVRSILL